MAPRVAADPLARRPLLLGVVHLAPLPGSPAWTRARAAGARDADRWADRAVRDATLLAEAGFDGILVENWGDAPFAASRVSRETIAAMAVAARAVRESVPSHIAIGINVLRNDARAAIAVAAAADLAFLRVNVLAGAVVADQGLVQGEAARVLRDRERLAPRVRIFADVRVKHAAPLAPRDPADEARDLVERAGADALIITGARTGRGADLAEARAVRTAVPGTPLLIGSGVTHVTVREALDAADGVIVGTDVERGGRSGAPVDARRAARFVAAARGR